jgi:hypothetical protein
VPCLMVVGSCQDLMTRLFVCGMWRPDLVNECWKGVTRYSTYLPPFSQLFSLLSSGFGHSEPRIGRRNSLCSRNSTPPVSVFGWHRSLSSSLSGSSFLPSDHIGISNPHSPQNWCRHSSSPSSSSTFLSPSSPLPVNLPYFVLPVTLVSSAPWFKLRETLPSHIARQPAG